MKVFLATAKLEDVRWGAEHGLIDGVLTTPALLSAEVAGDGRDLLAEICQAVNLPVVATVGAVSAADIHREGRDLARVSDSIIVQVPFVEDAIVAIRRLSSEGVRVSATLVFNAAQALLAAKAGAASVNAHLDQLDAQGQEGVEVVREIRAVFDAVSAECDVFAALPRTAAQFAGCALAGADGIALSMPVLRALMLHPLTDRGLDQLLQDLSRRPKARALQ